MKHLVPYTPQQNGVTERKNRALKEMDTCMMDAKDLYPNTWDEAINYSAYVHNRFPHEALEYKTPFKGWRGHKPNVSHFRVFGSKAWDRIPPEKRKSLKPQRKEYIIVVYAEYEKVYNLFDPSSHKTFIERSVQFKEEPMQEVELVEGDCSHPPLNDDVSDLYLYYFYDSDKED